MIEFLAECTKEVVRLRAGLQAVGDRALLEIQSKDPELAAELEAALEGTEPLGW